MRAKSFDNFVDIVFDRASVRPDDIAYRFHGFQSATTHDIVMGTLGDRVCSIGAGLTARDLAGERVVLALPHGPEFILAFYGCLAAGAVAVPVPMQRVGKQDRRFEAVIADARPALVLVDAASQSHVAETVAAGAEPGRTAPTVVTLDALAADPAHYRRPALGRDTLAVLQYTSGSTGDPKGVMITHGNIIANVALIQDALRVTSTSSGVLWLPFYHDMGLVGAVLLPMYAQGTVDLMSPQDFLRAPFGWLQKLSDIGATITAAPNFALELCCELATPEAIAGLDLSRLRCLLTGSEPVNPKTVERFTATFASCGFRADAYLPAYGLAEATLLATGTLRDIVGPTIRSFDARALGAGEVAQAQDGRPVQRLVGNGAPANRIRIADPETLLPLGEGEIGEIWLTGESIAKGYFNRPELSAQAFGARLAGEPEAGPFYRSGDLGFVLGDDLFIAGRIKDLIIVRGRNIHPQDVEETATRDEAMLWTGGAAAFALDRGQSEELVLVTEAGRAGIGALRDSAAAEALALSLVRRIVETHDVTPAEIVIVRPGRIPRTSSGKIRRSAAREEWANSGFSAGLIHRWTRPAAASAAVPAMAAGDASERLTRRDVENWLLERLAHHSGRPKHLIALDEPFASYGLDSVTAIEMITAINGLNIARTVDPTDLYDHPTIERLLDHMFAAVAEPETAGRAPAGEDAAKAEPNDLEAEVAALRALLNE